MRAPRVLEQPKEVTVHDRPRDPWRDGSRVHLVSGVSVLEAKRIVQTLDDAAFDSERAQLVQPLSKAMIEQQRGDRMRRIELVQPSPPGRAKPPRAPPPPPRDSFAFERTLMLLFLLVLLGLQLAQFVRV